MTLNEVAPPGFGHTKGDKEKGVKKGGTAAAFDRARKEGRFKGSKSDMFAIMWSQKNKGDKPHYKPGTNKKYKKYQEVDEARTVRSKEDAEKARQQRDNPDEWVVRNKGGGHHGLNRKSALKGQSKRRAGNLPSLKQKELEDHGKRNLHPDYKKTAKKAIKIERDRKKTQRADAQSKSKETGKQHDVDHIQGQSNRKKHSDRWHKIHPGDASDNRRVISQADNLKKNSKDTGGKKITRSSAVKRALDRARGVRKESAVLDANTKIKKNEKREKDKKELMKLIQRYRHMKDMENPAKALSGRSQKESFEIDKSAHKTAQKKAKLRNLAKGNTNPNEKAAAEKKAGGPKLMGEGKRWDSYKKAVATVLGKKKEQKKPEKATGCWCKS